MKICDYCYEYTIYTYSQVLLVVNFEMRTFTAASLYNHTHTKDRLLTFFVAIPITIVSTRRSIDLIDFKEKQYYFSIKNFQST